MVLLEHLLPKNSLRFFVNEFSINFHSRIRIYIKLQKFVFHFHVEETANFHITKYQLYIRGQYCSSFHFTSRCNELFHKKGYQNKIKKCINKVN